MSLKSNDKRRASEKSGENIGKDCSFNYNSKIPVFLFSMASHS